MDIQGIRDMADTGRYYVRVTYRNGDVDVTPTMSYRAATDAVDEYLHAGITVSFCQIITADSGVSERWSR